nr:MAG TPA: hypothetical protein [Caudoviricetes sp.]
MVSLDHREGREPEPPKPRKGPQASGAWCPGLRACTFTTEHGPTVTRNTGQRAATVSHETRARPVSMVATPIVVW